MNDHAVAQALGDLQGTVRSMAEQWRRQDENANVGRRAVYERLEDLSRKMVTVAAKLDGVTQDVAELRNEIEVEIMPTIEAAKIAAAKQSGAMSAGKIVWAFMAGIAGAIGFAVHEMLQYLKK
jgi:hypothetical protein